jgi:hypothetical protein
MNRDDLTKTFGIETAEAEGKITLVVDDWPADEPPPEVEISIECQGPWAIVHAYCPQGLIFQAWDGRNIFCPCGCHVDKMIDPDPEEVAAADAALTRKSDEAIRPGMEVREEGFIKSVLELRKALVEAGIVGGDNE